MSVPQPDSSSIDLETGLTDILDVMEAQVWCLHDAETYGLANQAHADFLGLPKSQIQNQPLETFLPREVARTCIKSNRQVCQQRQSIVLEEWVPNATGEARLLSITKTPRLNGDGEITSIVCVAIDLTEQRRVQQELRESQERLELAMDAAEHGFWDWNLTTNEVYYSPRWYTMLGYEPEELPMKFETWEILLHPEDGKWAVPVVRAAVERGSLFDIEFRMRCKNGSWRWIRAKGKSYEKDISGVSHRVVGTHEDVHHLKQTEALLAIEQEIALSLGSTSDLQQALDRLLDLVLQIDALDCGGVYLRDDRTGQFELVVHRNLSPDFIDEAKHIELDSAQGRLLVQGKPVYQHYEKLDLDLENDTVRQTEGLQAVAIVPICSNTSDCPGDSVVAALNLSSHSHDDIPETVRHAIESIATRIGETVVRLKMEAELHESRENLQTLFDTLEDFLFVTDQEGKILKVNPVVERRLGYSREELLSMTVLEVHPPERQEEATEIVAEMMAGRRQFCPIPLQAKDGSLIPVETRVKLGRWSERNVLFGISRDVTERKQAEDALIEERQLFVAGPTVVFKWRAEEGWPVEYVSQNLFEQLGYRPEELMSERLRFTEFVHPKDLEGVLAEVETHTAAGNPCFEQEYRLRHARGHYLWVYDFTTVVRQADGTVTHYLGYLQDISDRKAAEAALRNSEARWQFAIEGTGDGLWDWNLQTNEVFFSRQWKAMLGYEEDEIENGIEAWVSRVHPEDLLRCQAMLERHLRGETDCYQAEHRVRCKDGSYKWILDRGKVIERTEEGQPLRAIGIHSDISDRKAAEAAILEQEQFLRSIYEGGEQSIFVVDVLETGAFQFVDLNPAHQALTGLSAADLCGKTPQQVLPPDIAEAVCQRYRDCVEAGETISYEECLPFHGRETWWMTSLTPLRDGEGRIYRLIGTSIEISDRKAAEVALQDSNEQLQAFLDNSPAPVCLFDETGRYRRVNRSLCQLVGRSETEIVGRHFEEVLLPETAAMFRTRMRRLAETETPLVVEDWIPGDGGQLVFQSVLFLVRKRQGAPRLFGAIATDLTERVEAQRALQLRHRHEKGLELCSQALLGGEEGAIDRALSYLRKAAGVDRLYLFENFEDPDKGLCMRQIHEAVAPGVSSELDNPTFQHLSYGEIGIEEVPTQLERGESIAADVADLPERTRQLLKSQDVVSIVLLPIFVDRQWYGFIGFDSLSPRQWKEEDLRLLRLAAERIGSYLDRQKAHKEIQTAHQQLLSIFDGLESPVYVSDPATYEVLYVNEATRRNFGQPGARKCYQLLHDRSEPCPFCPKEQLFGNRFGQPYTWEHHNEIDRRWYRCTNKALNWPDGRLVNQGIAVDISDRKYAEEKLQEVNQKLEDYTYTISHDLKAPIRRIRYFVQFLNEDYSQTLDEGGRDYISRILKSTEKMTQTIDDLLVLSRVGRQDVEFKTVEIRSILEKIYQDLPHNSENVKLEFGELPSVFCQPTWIYVLFENLIQNGIKYNQKSPKKIKIGAREWVDRFEFWVEDNGLGIPPNCRDRVFDLFQRVHLDLAIDGSGAGLAIAKSIVVEHGGRIWIDWSEVGEGTRIKFTLSKYRFDRRS